MLVRGLKKCGKGKSPGLIPSHHAGVVETRTFYILNLTSGRTHAGAWLKRFTV